MKDSEKINTKNISIKRTSDLEKTIDYLSDKLLLNTTSIIRLALATLYEQEIKKEGRQKCQ